MDVSNISSVSANLFNFKVKSRIFGCIHVPEFVHTNFTRSSKWTVRNGPKARYDAVQRVSGVLFSLGFERKRELEVSCVHCKFRIELIAFENKPRIVPRYFWVRVDVSPHSFGKITLGKGLKNHKIENRYFLSYFILFHK